MIPNDIEILAPAGSWESLHAAIGAGADAVYFGVGALNMRSGSSANFTIDDLPRIVRHCRRAGVRTRLTVNTIIYEEELSAMRATVDAAVVAGIDAVIVSDQAAMLYAFERGIEVHISTQLNVSNSESLRFYTRWADTVVLARELSLEQVSKIHNVILSCAEGNAEHAASGCECDGNMRAGIAAAGDGGLRCHLEANGAPAPQSPILGPSGRPVRIEMFAHGALCMAVSGRCYLSAHDCGQSANRGACRQICRRSYTLTDTESGAQLQAEGGFLLSPKDLCTLPFLDRMLAAGVTVLKIEGRARGAEYVKRTVECYREAVQAVKNGSFTETLVEQLMSRLGEVFNRGFWGGYYLGAPTVEHTARYGSSATRRKVYVGKVTNFFRRVGVAEVLVEASTLATGDDLLMIGSTTGVLEFTAAEIFLDGEPSDGAIQGQTISLRTPATARRGDKLYKLISDK